MPAMSTTSLPKTPLDYVAEGYWQDFLANRPIAGDIAYEAALRDCQLDESMLSLQRLDTLLLQIRRDMIKSNIWDEKALLADERYRNFLIFLAFYTGRVLARQWQNMPHWYGQFELRTRYPKLPLITDDFYQHMAVLYKEASMQGNDTKAAINDEAVAPVFFALEPIGMRLFGHIDRQFQAVQGGLVASGLYQAVHALLPNATAAAINTVSVMPNTVVNADITATSISKNPIKKNSHAGQAIVNTSENVSVVPSKPVPTISPTPTPEIFTQLLTELDEIEVVQTAGNSDYQQARKILDQFERHIVKQHKPRAQVIFSEKHQASRKQTLVLLKKSATAGNTAAMLRLAMYELLGEGLLIDNPENEAAAKENGVNWVKQAASTKDSRAQRLLSRMYYQGIGVPQDINNGKHWLEQAAENGHLEAAGLVAQWQQAQILITTRKQEEHSFKRYQLLIGVVVVGALLLIIFV
ncbi:tetratricopeptide repeat protein [Psychrobacter urativorans]|uniref:tetratricopeptide repeat protein n=1 Tax=Psychrobacter urativorans TaxID=45610 RepID=UPI001D110477|nr:sel1 repeat family protein [Psychrobacter urativorans]